jgi:hypothetical protein
MSEPPTEFVPVHTQGRPFPWFCPNCRRQEVRRVTIPYQCQRFDNGQPITVVLSALEVPRCGNCGELVFAYDTEEQINHAYRAQTDARRNGTSPANGAEEKTGDRKAPL